MDPAPSAIARPPVDADIIEIAKDYVENILRETHGRKALIMDAATLAAVSMVYTRSEILQREVFLIVSLD